MVAGKKINFVLPTILRRARGIHLLRTPCRRLNGRPPGASGVEEVWTPAKRPAMASLKLSFDTLFAKLPIKTHVTQTVLDIVRNDSLLLYVACDAYRRFDLSPSRT